MNKQPIPPYRQVIQLAEQQGEAFAEVVSESFDDLENLGEFVDTLFYMYSITDDEQFAVYLGLMYEFIGQEMPDDMDCYIVMDQESNIFFSYFLTTLLRTILNQAGGDHPCPAM